MFRVMAELSGPWRFVAWLRWVPRPIADWAYGVFARNRYRMFGKLDSCALPTPAERARFVA